MTTQDLLTELEEINVTLAVSGDELVVRGKKQALSPALIEKLRRNKSSLIDCIRNGSYVGPRTESALARELVLELSPAEIERIAAGVPGGAANIQDIYPLAPLQEGILFHHILATAGDAYLFVNQFAFDTRERRDDFIGALNAVVARHDILRTSMVWDGLSEPVQVVWRRAVLPIEEVVLDPTKDALAQLKERFDPRQYRIDLRTAPMLRLCVAFDEAEQRWLLLMLWHHLIGDHTTLDMIQAEVQAHLLGQADKLPAPTPFRNLVTQARLGMSNAEHEAFFKQMLADIDEPTAPFGLTDVHGDGRGVVEAYLELEPDLSTRLRERARRLGISVASLHHQAWALVLSRLTGREDVVFGTVLFGRMAGSAGADNGMGLFINTLPVRLRVCDRGCEASVRRAQVVLAELLRHEHASLALAQRCSAVRAPAPLFTSLLNYRHSASAAQASSQDVERAWEGVEGFSGEEHSNYPLTLSIDDFGEAFGLTVQVSASVEAARVCALMHRALNSLVDALEKAPTRATRSLDVLPVAERRLVLETWNATHAALPQARVHELFEAQVARTPEATAVVFGAQTSSYAELNIQANRLARHLRSLGLKPGDAVAVLMERSLDLVVSELAILKAGAAYVPLDASFPVERLAFMIADCEAEILLVTGGADVTGLEGVQRIAVDQLELNGSGENLGVPSSGEAAAYIMYTSGSTGTPKGVMVPHAGVVRLAINNRYADFHATDRVAFAANPAFDATTMEVWGPLLNGGSTVVIDKDTFLDPVRLAAALTEYSVSALFITTAIFNQCAAVVPTAFRGLRYLLTGGERCDPSAFERVLSHGPPAHLIHCYGPTETTTFATTFEVKGVPEGAETLPIGRPIGNTQVYILDAHREPVPVGVVGELYIGGVGVALGYLKRPELTAERFVPDPFSAETGARLYKTGDLGKWLPDGTIEFIGRNDFQVKIRGFRIELGEIEARLSEHPGVREVVVLAREDVPGDKRLVAYLGSEQEPSAEELRAHLSGRLPEYMVPAAFVRMTSLPLTPNGKIDRKALPAPDGEAYVTRGYEAPVGDVESAVAQIWSEVLKVERVGRRDHFFELGGHSLLTVQVASRLRQALGVEVPISELFSRPTLAEFASGLSGAARSELPQVTRAERDGEIPLSFAQQRLWFLAQMGGLSEAYHIPTGLKLRGALDRAALRRALNRIVERHEALRTRFELVDGKPVQRIGPAGESRFHLLEQAVASESELGQLVEEEASAPFDLERGPLVRGRLIQEGTEQYTLLITMHHVVSDGWSMGVLVNEFSELYRSYVSGERETLAELPVQYADYALWQRRWVSGELLQRQAEYWKTTLAGGPTSLELPLDRARPAEQDFAGGIVDFTLNEGLVKRLTELSRRHGTTLFMTLLAGWAALLSRLSGQEEVVIGTPTANRGRREVEDLIGFFVNTLAIKLDLSRSPTVAALLERVKARTLEAQSNQDIPFEQVVELVNPPRSMAHSPLFQVMFAWQSNEEGHLDLPGLSLEPLPGAKQVMAKFDLTLSLAESAGRVEGGLEYASALFERATVERMLGCYRVLLESMVAEESQTVESLRLLPESERRLVVEEWNATAAPCASELCVHELFEAQVARTPEATAVVFGDESLSYAELNARSNRLARRLRSLGVEPDSRVAICSQRNLSLIVGMLAVLKAGGAYIPLDPSYPGERLRFMLEDSAPKVLLADAGLADGPLEGPLRVDLSEPCDGFSSTNLALGEVGLKSSHLAYVIYTSGSTGAPKGVMIEHRNTVNFLNWARSAFRAEVLERTLFATSVNFDLAVYELFAPLSVGGTVVLVRDALALAERAVPVTLVNTVPSAMRLLVDAGGVPETVRTVNLAGEALKRELVEQLFANTSVDEVCNLYGPSETTTYSTWVRMQRAQGFDRTIGRPVANTQVYILDARREPVPVGVTGELYIGGAGVARGYLNRAELTAERFVPDPFSKERGSRLYKTGDLGRWQPDGTIEYLGRNDFQVKIRGFRIELGEIEARLQEHAAVEEAVVLAREDAPGDKRLVAYVVSSEELSAEALRAHLTGRVPEYMVPAAFVQMAALPLTPNGKIDRKGLPAPEGDAFASRTYEAPVGEVEAQLAELWSELLRVERVGRHDNFFELGGHSLLTMTLIERMRARGLRADVRAIFASPTLARLAEATGRDEPGADIPPNLIPEGCDALTPEMLPLLSLTPEELARVVATVPGGASNIQDIYPLAPLQEGIFFHHLMASQGDAYLLVSQFAFDTRERLDHFTAALQSVIQRHDILRTAVVWENLSEPVQVVWRVARLRVEEVEVDSSQDVAASLRQRFDPRHHRIDLREAPMLRLCIAFDAHQKRWLGLLLWHHLVGDHSTLDLMREEVQAQLLGQAGALPEPVPFRNLVASARLGRKQEEHETFFRHMLGDVDEPTAPFGLSNAQGDGRDMGESRLDLDGALCRRLRARAQKLGISPASVCHQAWAMVLSRLTGREDVVFGTVLMGRMTGSAGADRAIGLFMNTLPLKLRVGEQSAEHSVRRAHEALAELMHHEHASLALAQRCSGVAAPTPLFTSLLNYRHSASAAQAPSDEMTRAWAGMEGFAIGERTNYPLLLSVDDLGEGFALTAQVDASVEAHRVCELMRRALESLLAALEDEPTSPVCSLDVLPEAERRQVVRVWNATEAQFPSERCVHELFEEQVRRTPGATAAVFAEHSLSYAELNARSNRLAHELRARGVKPDSRVAICAERSLELVVGLLAVLKAGGAYVPIDPSYPSERRRYMLQDSDPVVLLTQRGVSAGLGAEQTGLQLVDLNASFEGRSDSNLEAAELGLCARHLAYVIYTSGSTGEPKGAMNEHRAVVNRLHWMQSEYGLDGGDAVLQKTPFSFDVSVWEFFWPLLNGARLVLARPEGHKDPGYLLDLIRRAGVTTLHFVPSMLHAFLAHEEVAKCSGLKRVMCSGEALSVPAVERFSELLPDTELHNLYGPTEAAVDVTAWRCERATSASSVPIGRPIANTQMFVLDEKLRPTPIGVAGELYIGGVQVGRGYIRRPELTAARFVANPFGSGRLYRTGDLGRWRADGALEFLGRNDFQVKIRGFRIELGEIEARLLEHPEVEGAAVLAREDVPGQDKRLVAYLTSEVELSHEALRAHLTTRLPEYMLPAAFVRLARMPLTPSGKLDRKALPAPQGDAFAARAYAAPVGAVERSLAELWAKLLQVERVGRHDNFFELGGHSLTTLRAVSLASQAGIAFTLAELYAKPTVAELGAHLDRTGAAAHSDAAEVIREGGDEQPLFLVHDGRGDLLYPHLLAPHLKPGFPIFGLPVYPELATGHETMHSLARRMIGRLREVQPVGPYRIAGWSFGGTLAYEVAAQLLGDDQQLQFLGLLDTRNLAALGPVPAAGLTDNELLLMRIQRGGGFTEISDAKLSEFVEAARASSLDELLATLHAHGLGTEFDAASLRPLLELERKLTRLNLEYRAQPLHVPVHLFPAEEEAQPESQQEWQRVVSSGLLRTIPVPGDHDSMLREPNVVVLGKRLSEALDASTSLKEPKKASYAPALLLQAGHAKAAPLYCVPGAGASVMSFVDLVGALGRAWPVFGLQPRGLDGLNVPHTTVAAAVECYTRAVLAAHPTGPVHLLGHSFGGWIAFEMAHRLRALGREVASLVILDSESPGDDARLAARNTHLDALVKWLEICEMILDAPLGISRDDLASWRESERQARLHARLTEVGLMPRRSLPETLRAPIDVFASALRADYQPELVYPGRILMAVMDDPKLDATQNRAAHDATVQGWRRWAPDLSVYRAPGNHMTALKPPHVSDLVKWLLDGLSRGQSPSSRRAS